VQCGTVQSGAVQCSESGEPQRPACFCFCALSAYVGLTATKGSLAALEAALEDGSRCGEGDLLALVSRRQLRVGCLQTGEGIPSGACRFH